ncbi:NfeD family protein [Sansalvadorimonas sp. 2012CJ34-2]|uniref:NfeD family protein n=1 Tax=Parendozoicomonas callyspongiae TaxID=2942213 RepID=A0ABT0PEM0_9GAMM|nr:NfeD family protein [Sansalvadorimonas sp. 2012CJ34-2]MCL6269706.1 NfeD family protein [Sansalvadorimonas sp. 2012CJ34-2]
MDFLTELQPWHWVILTFLLLGLEALGAGGFLLGAVVASLLQALILWLAPDMSWAAQFSIFGAATLVFTICWWKFFRKSGQNTEEPLLNNRAAQQVGRVFVLEHDLPGGHGRVQLGDTMWKVKASETLHAGTTVIVSGAEGMSLQLNTHGPV